MFETLETIPWQTLGHAYGEASDIPDLLRNLISADNSVRKAAQYQFSCTVYHQGTVYSSTAYIVPFFCELLESEQVQDKPWLLDLLVSIAHGSSYQDVHVRNKMQRSSPEFQRRLAEELSWVQAAKEAVSSSYSTYLRLLSAKEDELRAYAAYTLGCCQAYAEQVIPRMRKCLSQEEDQKVQASILLSLGQLMPWNERTQEFFIQTLHNESEPLLRVIAAIACAFTAREAAPEEVVQVLLDGYKLPLSVKSLFDKLPYAEYNMDAIMSQAFRTIGLSIAPLVVPTLVQALKQSNAWSGLVLVDNLFYLALEDKIISNEMTVADLTDRQRAVLAAIVENDKLWELGNMEFTVGRFFEPSNGLDFSLRSCEDVAAFLQGQDSRKKIRLAGFIQKLKEMELTPKEAMDLLQVKNLINMPDYNKVLEQLKDIVAAKKQKAKE